MVRILLIICFLLSQEGAIAQVLKFSQSKWDFGTIKEDGGSVSHTFEFVNTTQSPIVITNVRTTCGCTTPEYSKKPISANETRTMEITYDPMYRPGAFSRDISIFTSADNEPVVINITGFVTPRQRSIEERFPYIVGGGVRISSLYSYMQNVSHNNPTQAQLEIINTADQTKKVEVKVDSPASNFLSVGYPEVLAPGESGNVNLTYDVPQSSGFYGELRDNISVYVDGVKSKMEISVRAYAVENFGDNQKKGSARGHFSKNFINFEAFNLKSTDLTRGLSIENMGTARLYIRGVDLPSGVAITSSDGADLVGMEINPAEILELLVTLQSADLELGPFVKYATFIVSDPEQPVVRVKIVGEVSN